jgi:NitT/TauT family transport system ATP-binding protein
VTATNGTAPQPPPVPEALPGPAGQPRAKVSVRSVSKRFDTKGGVVEALRDVDLEVREGEFMCLVGPSGCGKSTLLRILARAETHTAGEIVLEHDDPSKPLSNMVFQERSAFPWMNVIDNVAYGLQARGVGRGERRAVAQGYVEKVGLGGFESAHPHQLSGGMQQRVAVARAFANGCELLLMDEPFGALDEQLKVVMQEQLLDIWEAEEKKTVVFVTHSIDEALLLGDRIAVFGTKPGRIKEIIDVPFARPRHLSDLKLDPGYVDLSRRIWDSLRDEVEKAYAS